MRNTDQKKVAVFTGTRAEYGLLYWLLKELQSAEDIELQLIVSGMHVSTEFGLTYHQIQNDGFDIDEKVEILLSSSTAVGTAKSIGLGVIGFAEALSRLSPNLVIILGDRFEALSMAQTAMVMRVPILHLHGGEISEGAIDDSIRHAISKMSFLHCVSTETHRQRVIQLGENPNKVYNVGALGLEHIERTNLLSLKNLASSLQFDLKRPFFLVTYHPATLEIESSEEVFSQLLSALNSFLGYQIILTYPNADEGGREIIELLEQYAYQQPKRVFAIKSLGQLRYLSALKYCTAVIGNSSSGIIEAPSFGIPTVNIGSRQHGREVAETIIHVENRKKILSKELQGLSRLQTVGSLPI